MKSARIKYITVGVVTTLLLFVSWSIIGTTQNNVKSEGLSFTRRANKDSFLLGEPVKVEFQFVNNGETAVLIPNEGVEIGALKIFIAGKDKEYKRYSAGFGWGTGTGFMTALAPNQTHEFKEAVILWNGKPNVSHLNPDAAKEFLKGRITTEYAFPEVGVYFIKGVSGFGENGTIIESEPIEIVIKEPTDNDLKVWKLIKGRGGIAYLMQSGQISTSKYNTDESAIKGIKKLVEEVEQIIQSYPNSIYSDYLKQCLEKFRVNEKKREEAYKFYKRKI